MIYNKPWNHKNIIADGNGASEFQFYMLANSLSELFNITIFGTHPEEKIDNIQYRYINDIFENKNINEEAIVIINRFFDILLKINKFKKIIIWSHDWNPEIFMRERKKEIMKKLNKIEIICVSKTHKDHVRNVLKLDKNVTYVYNALYPEYFLKDETIIYNKNRFIFASSFAKGIQFIIKIFDKYYQKNKDLELILIKPSYCKNGYEKRPYIKYLDNVKCKKEMSKLIQSCLCLMGSRFRETFGCIFAEAYHLGVPVIGDNSLPTAVKEIINNDHICNFNNQEEVIQKIEEFRENRPVVFLDKKFYKNVILDKWKILLNN